MRAECSVHWHRVGAYYDEECRDRRQGCARDAVSNGLCRYHLPKAAVILGPDLNGEGCLCDYEKKGFANAG
jgi:hypothetical protein